MTTGAQPPRRESAFALVRRFASGTVELAKLEAVRGRQEITENVISYRTGVVFLAIALAFAVLMGIVLMILLVFIIAELTGLRPWIVALGFVGLAISASLAALIVLQATFSAVQRSIIRPARETLFTVVPREDKYKAKAFIDTFVYRVGDVVGAQVEGLLGRLAMGLAALVAVTVPLAIVWGVLGVWLGRAQQRRITDDSAPARTARREKAVAV